MKTEEEVENLYDEEKKKALEKFLAGLEKKENREVAEQRYKKYLNTLFEKYTKLKIGVINAETSKAKAAAAKKAKPKQQLFVWLKEKLGPLARLVKR